MTNGLLNPFELSAERSELAQLVGRIQTLTLELQESRRREHTPAVAAKGTNARAAALATRGRRPPHRNRSPGQRRMTTTAAAAIAARTAAQLRGWLSVRHSLRAEAIAVLVLYGLYELARGLVVGDPAEAERHAHRLVALERSLHLFVEANLQRAAHALPGLTSLLDVAYLTLHLAVTAAVLLWLHPGTTPGSSATKPSSGSSSTREQPRSTKKVSAGCRDTRPSRRQPWRVAPAFQLHPASLRIILAGFRSRR